VEPFTRLVSFAAPLWIENVEADQLIPAKECVRPAGASYGDALFAPWRYLADGSENPEFVLNVEPYRTARILVTGSNFGYGSSREHAAWAVRDFGLRALVAPSFASIFRANAVRNGVLPVELDAGEVAGIVGEISPGPAELAIDLPAQTVVAPSGRTLRFEISPLDKEMLVEGIDGIGLAQRYADEVAAFETRDRRRRPWVYGPLSSGS
jgi:3-isopropylmalate/(R)-2-methylmalate dehydratase small subunit